MSNLKIGTDEVKDIGLVIFDRDGTLIELFHYWSKMIEIRVSLICEALELDNEDNNKLMFEMGVDCTNQRLRPEGPVGLKKRKVVMQAAVDYLSSRNIENAFDACKVSFEKADQLSLGRMGELVKPIGGAFELVESLKGDGCRLAIATTDKEERCRITIDAINKLDSFSEIVGADTVKNGKPSSDMIDLITKKLGIAKDNTIMIGDALSDVKMGINARVRASVGVCSGLASREALQYLTNFVIKDVSEIKVL